MSCPGFVRSARLQPRGTGWSASRRTCDHHRLLSTQSKPGESSGRGPFPLPASKQATPYEVFHLPRNSSSREIKARYYDLVKIYHPDRALARHDGHRSPPSSSTTKSATLSPEQAHEDFKRVREAYVILSNDAKRRLYDQSGMGWDPSGDNHLDGVGVPVWKGGFPKTAQERAVYEAWSSSLRRGSPGSMNRQGWQFRGQGGGHDRYGWQAYAGDSTNMGSDWFYGFGHARQYANPNREPMYTTNARFMITLSLLTTILGIGQYMRLREESKTIIGVADRRHQDAAKSLVEARNFARSEIGRTRMDEMRRRARERMPAEGDDDGEAWDSIGRGGPSGREAYEERVRRIGRSSD